MRVIGVCRFSYPALGGFKRMHDSVAEREAYLYSPSRMELRFRHFEALTLPSIAAQTDPDFTFLIVIGQNMPRQWLDRLHDLTTPLPQVRILPMPPMKHRLALQQAIQQGLGDNDSESLQFRLDDDDAVGVDFIEQARGIARRSGRLRRHEPRLAIEFNSGWSVGLSEHGIGAEEVISSFWACALAVLFPAGDTRTIMNYGHHKLHHVIPAIIQPRPPMYLRAKHTDNDSEAKYKTGPLAPLTEAQAQLFRDRFNVDEARVRQIFSAPPAPRGRA